MKRESIKLRSVEDLHIFLLPKNIAQKNFQKCSHFPINIGFSSEISFSPIYQLTIVGILLKVILSLIQPISPI